MNSNISEVIIDCTLEKACCDALDEPWQSKLRMSTPYMTGYKDVLIDGKWEPIADKCLVEVRKIG